MRITLSIPDTLAQRFLAIIPSRERSMTVARLLENELTKRENTLMAACLAANKDQALNNEITEWQAINDDFEEPVA